MKLNRLTNIIKPWNRVYKRQIRHVSSIGLYQELKQRNLISNCSSEEIDKLLKQEKCTIYCGVDPTGDSLHIGHLFSFMTLLRFQKYGHKAIALIGGATGAIGDPSGKSSERKQMEKQIIERNQNSLKQQLQGFFDLIKNRIPELNNGDIQVRNNIEWFSSINFIDFINHTGRYVRVSSMLNKESVKSRLNSEQGISFTEFSYQLLQAYDFWHLYHHENCKIQIGGGDQWGNIVSGIDLINKKPGPNKSDATVYGITTPLLTTSSGHKIGKSAGNAIWLDKNKTSPYVFYQYFMKVQDNELLDYLLRFTFLPVEECHLIFKDHMIKPELLNGQRELARNVTRLIHGDDGVEEAEFATNALFSADKKLLLSLNNEQLEKSFKYFKDLLTVLPLDQIIGIPLVHIVASAGLCKSKGEATRLIKSGGLYLNHQRVNDPFYKVNGEDLLNSSWGFVLRAGKSNYKVVQVQ